MMDSKSASKAVDLEIASADFRTTHWSIIMLAGREHSQDSQAALERLCIQYWPPVYSHARRFGMSPHDAKDATQGFFYHMLETGIVTHADPLKGKFRNFLLHCFKNFLATQHQRANAAKRGGGKALFSLDEMDAENRYCHEPVHLESPDVQFDRRFAVTLIESTLKRQEAEWSSSGKAEQFAALKPHLTTVSGKGISSELCGKLGLSSGAALVALSRARGRFRELFRNEVMQTVANREEFEQELRYILELLSGPESA